MKSKFSTLDLVATLAELQSLRGMRLINVYDVDNKTYLFKLSSKETKAILLAESGCRIHVTEYDWPKGPAPSGFTMKLRKHIHNRRLENITQLGIDRIVDLQFGSNEAAYHIILELYDRGNFVLTDHQYVILNILRPRTEGEDTRFAVREVYHTENAKQKEPVPSEERLREIIMAAKVGDNLKKVLMPHLAYGPAVIDHVLLKADFSENCRIEKEFFISTDIGKLISALEEGEKILEQASNGTQKGFIIQKREKKAVKESSEDNGEYLAFNEFHPLMFLQHEKQPFIEFTSFNKAIDEYFSKIESQKIDLKAIQKEREALKKLDNVKKDHEQRIHMLQKTQEEDEEKAQLIEMNVELVDRAIVSIQSALASQLSWKEISSLLQEAQTQGDIVAKSIKALKLDTNHIAMKLSNPYDNIDADDKGKKKSKPLFVDIDLDLTAYANAKKYYDLKRHAAKKEQKTIESSSKAFKSAEKKTHQTLKEVATVTTINKTQKTYWFEKFFWFISSENYLVIGGRDQQQNELIVKRYLRMGDIYVHADLHGASSIVIKNPSGNPVPPKTLNEAGTMAVCYSIAWNAKVVTSAWWVYHHQVSKSAPSGEYLTTGSFMIRGKKNYLPPCYLIMGFGFLFKLDEESIPRHKDERRVKALDEVSEESVQSISQADSELFEESIDGSNSENNSVTDEYYQNEIPLSSVAEEDISSSESESSSEEIHFPNTVVSLEHVQGDKFRVKTHTDSTSSQGEETVVFLGDDQPVVVKSGKVNKPPKNTKHRNGVMMTVREKPEEKPTAINDNKGNKQATVPQLKRGQKYKLKKMKEKYKDQDEEDHRLAMELIKPMGSPKAAKKKGKLGKNAVNKEVKGSMNNAKVGKTGQSLHQYRSTLKLQNLNNAASDQILQVGENMIPEVENDEQQVSDDEKDDTTQTFEDAKILDSLTAQPVIEDILLFSVPVCAPYSCMANYKQVHKIGHCGKFKVKLTPGTGKRGKAAKTALSMFQMDKSTTQREKDLLRSIKDQDIARNLPGKVKLSAPQLLRQKKR